MAIELKAKEGCCEEASTMSHNFYIPCNAPAVKVLRCDKDKRDYRMCDMCAHHNLKRGMVEIEVLPERPELPRGNAQESTEKPIDLETKLEYQALITKWTYFKQAEKDANEKRIEAENELLAMVKDELRDRGTNNFPLGLKIVTGETEAWDQAELAKLSERYDSQDVDLPYFPFETQLKPNNKKIQAILSDVKYNKVYIKFVANAMTVKPKKASFSIVNKK